MPGVFTPQKSAHVSFYVSFFETSRIAKKAKNPVPIENTRFFVELLPGFEPGTSSLPIEPSLIFLVFACCNLMPESIDTAGFFFLPCFILPWPYAIFHVCASLADVSFNVSFIAGPSVALALGNQVSSETEVRFSGFCSGRSAGARMGEIVAAIGMRENEYPKWEHERRKADEGFRAVGRGNGRFVLFAHNNHSTNNTPS